MREASGSSSGPHAFDAGTSSVWRRAADASASSVSGLTKNACHARRCSTRLSAARRSRSRGANCGLTHLPPQDRQLVTQHEDLELLRALAAPEQHDQLEQTAGKDVHRRHGQEQRPVDGNADATPTSNGRAGATHTPSRRVCAPHGQLVLGTGDPPSSAQRQGSSAAVGRWKPSPSSQITTSFSRVQPGAPERGAESNRRSATRDN